MRKYAPLQATAGCPPQRPGEQRYENGIRHRHLEYPLASHRRLERALSRAPHLLRRPQLRRASEGNGRRRPRAAVLLREVGARSRSRRRSGPLPADDDQFPLGNRAGRGDRHRRLQDFLEQGRRPRLGLCGRARHDSARSPASGQGQGSALDVRQGFRPVRSGRTDQPRLEDRTPEEGQAVAQGKRRIPPELGHRPDDLERARTDRVSHAVLHARGGGPRHDRHAGRSRRGR